MITSLLLAGTLMASQPANASRPNIVYIMADDLGYTDPSCYGSKYYETPNIDRLASQGMRFLEGYSCGPNCQPTRAALMSGQYGARTGVYTVGSIDRFDWQSRPLKPVDNVQQLPKGKVTIADALKASGYSTALFGKWHLGQQGDFLPNHRGFDESIVSMGKHFNFETTPDTRHPKDIYLADFLTNKAVDYIKRHKEKPFFLCVHHFGVHSPYEAKPELVQKFKNKPGVGGHKNPVYAAMLYSVDESVGRILKILDEQGLSRNTLVIFTSDNGGVGGYGREKIKAESQDATDNAPLRGGKGMLYEGGIRVPYIFRMPGTIPEGTTSSHRINSVDLYPTLLELSGSKAPGNYKLDGVSYLPALQQKTIADRVDMFWHFPGYLGAGPNTYRTTPVSVIRSGNWKLLEFLEDGKLELYDISQDIGEKNDLSKTNTEKTSELAQKLRVWRTGINAPMPTKNTPKPSQPGLTKKKKKVGN